MRRVLVIVGLATTACAPAKPDGSCFFWSDCGPEGACEYSTPAPIADAVRFECSFPDAECNSGRRFGEFASAEVADTCVPFASSFDGLCDVDHGCDPGHACSLGRCINIKQLDSTADLLGALCWDRERTGGDGFIWGISFAVFMSDLLFAPSVLSRSATT